MAVKTYIGRQAEIFGETSGGARRNYLRDALGSVVAETDSANAKLYSARYKPYGSTLTSTGAEPSFTWAGTLGYLKAAGVTYSEFSVRARFYSSTSSAWTRLDPLWPEEVAFMYSSANPATITDPTGMKPVCAMLAIRISGQCTVTKSKKRLAHWKWKWTYHGTSCPERTVRLV